MMPGALGSRPFDGEGLPTRRTVVVGDGVLESYLLDTYSGHKLGMASTHHAARDGSGVTVGTTNLMLLPGPATPEEIIGSVRNGLYVTELIGFGVNGVTGDYCGARPVLDRGRAAGLSRGGSHHRREPARHVRRHRRRGQRPRAAGPHGRAHAEDLAAWSWPGTETGAMIIDTHCHLHHAAFADVRETLGPHWPTTSGA